MIFGENTAKLMNFPKYIFFAAVALLIVSAPFSVRAVEMVSPTYKLQTDSPGNAGGAGSSGSYGLDWSGGEPAVGEGITSTSYGLCEGRPCSGVNAPAPPTPPAPGGGGGGGVSVHYVITDPVIDQISATGARAGWKTDFLSDSFVSFGATTAYGSAQGDVRPTEDHEVIMTGLAPGTAYHLEMRSTDARGTVVRSGDLTFTTNGADIAAPADPAAFTANPGDGSVSLAWQNPVGTDFAGVRIERSGADYPKTPGDGTKIFEGAATAYVDAGLKNGATYYYTIWSFDASLNYSSGALASAEPAEAAQKPPQTPPDETESAPGAEQTPPAAEEPPAVAPPGSSVYPSYPSSIVPENPPKDSVKFSAGEMVFTVNGANVSVGGGVLSLVTNVVLRAELPASLAGGSIANAYLRIGDFAYRFAPGAGGVWSADVEAPDRAGAEPSAVIVEYADKTTAYSGWTTELVAPQIVDEMLNGKKVPLSDAVVTLLAAGAPWNPGASGQKNPQVTGADGSYYFFAPPGDYSLKVERTGYETQTLAIKSANGIVSAAVDLTRAPEPLAPGASAVLSFLPASANIAVTKAAKFFKDKVIDNPRVIRADNAVVAPVATAATAIVATSLDLSFLLYFLYFIFLQPLALLDRRRSRTTGTVYNALNKLPLDLAFVRLIDSKTGRIVRTRVTDATGRILFIAPPAEYSIVANRSGYSFPAPTMQNASFDPVYREFYKGGYVGSTGEPISPNIPLEPVNAARSAKKAIRARSVAIAKHVIASSTTVIGLLAFAVTPNAWTGLNSILQLAVLAAVERHVFKKRVKKVGRVLNAAGVPVRAVVRLFETTYDKLVETAVTDGSGRFAFLVGANKYYVVAEAPGAGSVKSVVFDFSKERGEHIVAPELKIAPEAPRAGAIPER